MPNVLLVDDEDSIRSLYSKLLTVDGFHVNTAQSGEEALFKVSSDRPDIILLDISLPEMSGIDFLSRIKSDNSTADIPVLMFTGSSEMQVISECLDKGAAGYIIKGEDHEELVTKVNLLIRLKRKS